MQVLRSVDTRSLQKGVLNAPLSRDRRIAQETKEGDLEPPEGETKLPEWGVKRFHGPQGGASLFDEYDKIVRPGLDDDKFGRG